MGGRAKGGKKNHTGVRPWTEGEFEAAGSNRTFISNLRGEKNLEEAGKKRGEKPDWWGKREDKREASLDIHK